MASAIVPVIYFRFLVFVKNEEPQLWLKLLGILVQENQKAQYLFAEQRAAGVHKTAPFGQVEQCLTGNIPLDGRVPKTGCA